MRIVNWHEGLFDAAGPPLPGAGAGVHCTWLSTPNLNISFSLSALNTVIACCSSEETTDFIVAERDTL